MPERPVLTLHHGDAEAKYVEHPIEAARRALRAAAETEDAHIASALLQIAAALPDRSPLAITPSPDGDGYGPAGSALRRYNLRIAWREEARCAEVAKREWMALSAADRARVFLDALRDDVLTGAEIVRRINEVIGKPAGMKMMGGGSLGPVGMLEVRSIGAELARVGDVHRELNNRRHFLYSRTG